MGIEHTTLLLLAPYSIKLSLNKYTESFHLKNEEEKEKIFYTKFDRNFQENFPVSLKKHGWIREFEVKNKTFMNSCEKQTVFCAILFNIQFLSCIYCCGLWVFCRALGWWLTSICHSAASLGQKWRCAGGCAFLQRWKGQTQLLGYSSATMRKLQWMWMQEVKYIWNQTHMLCGYHTDLGHWKDVMMPM